MTHISNFETSDIISERMQGEGNLFLGCVGQEELLISGLCIQNLVWLFYNPAGNAPQQLENEFVAGGWGLKQRAQCNNQFCNSTQEQTEIM